MTTQVAPEPDYLELEPPFDVHLMVELGRAFAKAVRAHQLYLPNNPMHTRAIDMAREAFSAVWNEADSIAIEIDETALTWMGNVVLEEPGRTSDSIPWMLYKDGVRELVLYRGFEESELLLLLTLMQRARVAGAEDDDLLTFLWEHEFTRLQYKYVDLANEGNTTFDIVRGVQPDRIAPPGGVEDDAQELASSSITRMDEYDSTLYFLEDSEVEYLQNEIRRDFGNDLRVQVIASLLDTYETETDPEVRDEIAAILDNFFLLLLSLAQFRTAAYLIREAAAAAGRATDLLLSQRQRLLQLSDRLSEREALEQLLHALEETPLRAELEDLQELFGQLRADALETLLYWIGRTRNSELRALLEAAGSRLASEHTAELVRLIASDDPVVAFEAVRRSGALRAAAAVSALAGVFATGGAEMRLAGVAALAEIGTPGALQVLERALFDEDRDIRIATVKLLGARNHRGALKAIEGHLRTRELRESTLAEKMAFFESYAALCGDDGAKILSGILNSRRILGKREDSETRACSAMALGKLGSPDAMRALQKAMADRDVIVRNAVSRAVRG